MISIKSFLALIIDKVNIFLNKLKVPDSFLKNRFIEANFMIDNIPIKCQLEYYSFNQEYYLNFEGYKPCVFTKNNIKYITGLPSVAKSKIIIKSFNNITENTMVEIIEKGSYPNWQDLIGRLTSH